MGKLSRQGGALGVGVLCAAIATSHSAAAQTPALPLGWMSSDIGNPVVSGRAESAAGTFTVRGAGAGIIGTPDDQFDQFHFLYQPVTGDTEIVARFASLQAADAWSKAGVMIREALTDRAAHAGMVATGSNGWAFQRRLFAGGAGDYTAANAGDGPAWMRLVREGNLFSAYQSQDGSQWTLVGSETISMPATVYVGLAVTSHNVAATATATFSNVAIGAPTSSNKPPTVWISSPTENTSRTRYMAPAAISISAAAGDVDGLVTGVDFYAGAQFVGSSIVSPFTITWSNVRAGTYGLTAVAADNAGATAFSLPVSVTVTAGPTKLVFVPSADNATKVTSYTVQLRRSGDATTATPVASRDLGKPVVVNGQISVDISSLVDPLPAGSYYAVVLTTGLGGSTPSSPSAVFSN